MPAEDIASMTARQVIEVCDQIIVETANDVASIDGRVFDGRNVAELLGSVFAGVDALARICRVQQREIDRLTEWANRIGGDIPDALDPLRDRIRNLEGQLSDLRGE